ncbi:nucleotide-excision repair, DNA incision, 3'-to lesion [Tritrichomonas musculus]|uniref:Nucleotide-excision repair, DNA incision, 3'-to lesion n=1 Tax=Tritrichomonas musculus TaxID=1915356 RepID=A0ABR2HDN0_9EUKA
MGVPGLWRIIDLASQPLDLEKCSGLRIAIDINSHANRLVHSQSASNWIYILARDFFRILHFNIRIVVVLMGRRPLEKIYSTALGDESQDTTYYRVRSLIVRSNKESPKRNTEPENKPTSEPVVIHKAKVQPRKRIDANLEEAENINEVSQRQIDSMSKNKPLPPQQLIHHSNVSGSYVFFEQNQSQPQKSNEKVNQTPKDFKFPVPSNPNSNIFYSDLFDDIKDIISEDDPSSEGAQPPEEQQLPVPADTLPISLLPDDNTYLPPIENYLTATHIRLIEKLCSVLGIPVIKAPEEAAAECARLEREKIVDAVATEDNNAVLFGCRWMIRGIFTRPQSITIETIEKVGLTRERLIMIAMMIDGDYNMDIKKRLFTVGPVRGMEILSLFPDEKDGLFQFKKWWIRVVKNKGKEDNPSLRKLSRMKWLKKLIMPERFPPIDLLDAFKKPTVGDVTDIDVKFPKFDADEVIAFIRQSSSVNEERIREITTSLVHRVQPFYNNEGQSHNLLHFAYVVNPLRESPTFQLFIDRLILYDRAHKKSDNEGNEDDDGDEWDTVSEDGSGSDKQDDSAESKPAKSVDDIEIDDAGNEEEEEEEQDSIEEA